MTSPLILIAAEGGLCNRLRVLLSAAALQPSLSTPIRVAWADNAECAARFDQLFEPLHLPPLTVTPRSWKEAPALRSNAYLPYLYRLFFFDAQRKNYLPAYHLPLPFLSQRYPRIYLSTCYAFASYAPDLLRQHIRPLPHLQERIDALVAQFVRPTIGVHIRRTDNVESIAHSPTSLFLAAMEQHPTASFYLSTDDLSLKATLQKRYGDRLITQHTTARRDTLEGIEEAVIDLFVLSRTDRLLGSYWSSFTDTAAELGGMPVDIVRASS